MPVNDAPSTWRGSGENHYNDGRGAMEMMERGHAGSERMNLLHALDGCVCVCVCSRCEGQGRHTEDLH